MMRCPVCNWYEVFEKYDQDDNTNWVRKICCPICNHQDTLEINEDETLEDFLNRYLSTKIAPTFKFDAKNCFSFHKKYENGFILDIDGYWIHVILTVKPYEKERKLWEK